MRSRCSTHESGAPQPSEPVISGPDHAASVIRASAPPPEGPAVVVLLCDSSHRLIIAVTVDGAPPSGAAKVVDLVLSVAGSAGVSGIVVGIVQPRLGQYIPKPDADTLAGLAARCERGGVHLLDLLLVGPRGWRSIRDLAGES